MAILMTPAITTPFAPTDPEAELQELEAAPTLINTDGHPNVGFLADAGEWFDDHFGFRQALITAYARMNADALATSPTSQVIVGREGYLYYGGTLADYARTDVMTEAAADNAAFNLAMMEASSRARGADFLLAVAPDKNSLYPEYMPAYDLEGTGESSWERLRVALDAYGVSYVDLFESLGSADDVLYMKTDTHWNTEGALHAYNAMMELLRGTHLTYADSPRHWDDAFIGDLEAMLYPLGRTPERREVVEDAERFRYVNEATTVEDSEIVTASTVPDREGSLVMFRDSFGNALLPFFATQYAQAYFTKLVPYYLQMIDHYAADAVIVERAERHLSFFATTPPLMDAPQVSGWTVDGEIATDSTIAVSENGPYLTVSGIIDRTADVSGDHIFIVVTDDDETQTWYEAFHQTVDVAPDDAVEQNFDAATLTQVEAHEQAVEHPAQNDDGYYASIPRELISEDAGLAVVVGEEGHGKLVAMF